MCRATQFWYSSRFCQSLRYYLGQIIIRIALYIQALYSSRELSIATIRKRLSRWVDFTFRLLLTFLAGTVQSITLAFHSSVTRRDGCFNIDSSTSVRTVFM